MELVLIDTTDWSAPLARVPLYGGQGTINVNSWSPDSTRFAFVSYPSQVSHLCPVLKPTGRELRHGLYTCDIARALGASDVLYVDPDPAHRKIAESYGARTAEAIEPIHHGFDLAIESIGQETEMGRPGPLSGVGYSKVTGRAGPPRAGAERARPRRPSRLADGSSVGN